MSDAVDEQFLEYDDSFAHCLELATRRYTSRPVGAWQLGRVPHSQRTALIVDGFNSRSEDHASVSYSEDRLGIQVAAFSYYRAGRHYIPTDTQQSVHDRARRLAGYLPRDGSRVVTPIGVSAGAVIVVLGVANWIRRARLPDDVIRRSLPSIVLVAPGISPSSRLPAEYPNRPSAVPLAVRQLCQHGSVEWLKTQDALIRSFEAIGRAGIGLRVICWQADILTPFPWYPAVQAVADRVAEFVLVSAPGLALPLSQDPAYEKRGVQLHHEFYRRPMTIGLVRALMD